MRLPTVLSRISNNAGLLWKFRRFCSSNSLVDILSSNSEKFSGEHDQKFRETGVQNLLKQIIGRHVDLDKVFKTRKEPLKLPTYQLLTDEEVLEVFIIFEGHCHIFEKVL